MTVGAAGTQFVTPIGRAQANSGSARLLPRLIRPIAPGLTALAAGWAGLLALSWLLVQSGLLTPDWVAIAAHTGAPWRQILNPWLGPQLLLLNGLLAAGYLAARVALSLLAQPRVRLLLGDGLLAHGRWLIACGLYPGLLAALYAAAQLDVQYLRVTLEYAGEEVILTAPTLLSVLLFAAALASRLPGPLPSPPRVLRTGQAVFMVVWSAGLVLYLDRAAGSQWIAALEAARSALIAVALSGWALGYLLVTVQAGIAHSADVRRAIAARRHALAGLAALRMAAHLAIMLTPVVMGLALAWFIRLPAASVITDRYGRVLQYRYPAGEFRLPIPAAEMPRALCLAADAIEDAGICTAPATHLPVSPQAVGRNLTALMRRTAAGAGAFTGGSGLAAQVCKNVFGRPPVDWAGRLVRGAPLAAVTGAYKLLVEFPCAWVYERAALLAPADRRPAAAWLNLVPFGRGAYGVEAASLSYFAKPAAELTPAEALFIVSRAQAPYAYDPAVDAEAAAARTAVAAGLLLRRGYLTPADYAARREVTAAVLPESPYFPFRADSAFIEYAAAQLAEVGFTGLSRRGLTIRTALDADLQAGAEAIARRRLADLQGRDASAAALVAIEPATGAILAMASLPAATGGLNLALTPRQPGSAIKPLVYLAALEAGWTPATVVWDLPRAYQTPDGPYQPVNYDRRFRGPVQVRYALANSYNAPAVATLDFVGSPAFLARARAFGLTTLGAPADYGPALALGSAEVSLLELTAAYAALANQGARVPPTAILEVTDARDRVLYRAAPQAARMARPEDVYLITDILADDAARTAAFGAGSALHLDRPAAAKTGTTNDYRDSWTVGYTPDLAVGVWVGNADNSPMADVAGLFGAAPIWHTFMVVALQDRPARAFERPAGVVAAEVCTDSGARPAACPARRTEIFTSDRLPPGPEADWWQACSALGGQVTLRPDRVTEPAAQAWLIAWAKANRIRVGCAE